MSASRPRGPRRARARILVALAVAAAVPLVLSGCLAWFQAPRMEPASTPTGEEVAADLEPYYHQVLEWEGCGDGMQCATATAPLDWASIDGEDIELALVRQPAQSGEARGSILVNPGGPGGSGVDFVLENVDYATSERLQSAYDIVGFDPRGVGRSSAVSCADDDAALDHYLYDVPDAPRGGDAWIAASEQSNREFGEACLEHTGPLLEHVDTESAARDLDMLRAALGDETLGYLGYSYGTFLGATYAELFPEKTGRLVLDGALDPAASEDEVSLRQAIGFESAYRAYLEDCLEREGCPFRGTVEAAQEETRGILDRLDRSPLRSVDGRELGSGTMFTAIILPLYNPTSWPALDSLLESVRTGDATVAFNLADQYYERDASGRYASNATEALIAINCLDYTSDDDPATMREKAAALVDAAPVFGPQLTYGGTGCAQWPFQSTRERGPIAAAGSADILVVGTTNDPATPYVWSERLAGQLENGHLVTYEGEGHTAYNKSNACVNDAVDDYLIDGTVPAADPRC
ncbi:alpha/beta hydrolase [Homoserinibacter sp. YIM 151385]|uniref:alpha/beta hydrolase n=1 Tax=Homoserinibacter sp. YIM 151385 TaxID=2985506 RepID=UPI0022F07044|nr:alpha/beta hydrolase [Homoserinibacter sp. YIM 151385]WBU36861.1 alpha/beta hydrolase [Homoserinibacter sp. YIM 151385]